MDTAISQIYRLVECLFSDYQYINRKKIGIWIKEGNYLDSNVQISLENYQIDYEVFFYLNKKPKEAINKKELFVYLHELIHIVILEKLRRKKGIDYVEKYIDKYNDDVKKIGDIAREECWDKDKTQEEYEKIGFENNTNILTKKLINKYDYIAS
jgi:hypothetical protein